MNPHKEVFIAVYGMVFLYSCFFLIWSRYKPWTPKEHLIAYLAGWSLLAGSLLRLLIDLTGTMETVKGGIAARTGSCLMSMAFGVMVCLAILTSKSKR
jgi:hypothetical protein